MTLDPDNPEIHSRLSRLYTYSLGQLNIARGVAEARRATDSSPYNFRYWMNLGSACQSIADNPCEEEALRRAVALSPVKPFGG